MKRMDVGEWVEQLRGDRKTLEDIMLRLGAALNGPARDVSRITETKIAHEAVQDAMKAMDRLIGRVPLPGGSGVARG
jgi:hypothetical protein